MRTDKVDSLVCHCETTENNEAKDCVCYGYLGNQTQSETYATEVKLAKSYFEGSRGTRKKN